MFVTVFLTESKMRTVVPKKFIYRLCQVNLDNRGVNRNQNRRIYFSKNLFELLQRGENPNLTEYEAKFDLPTTQVYPLPSELQETCFIGRTIRYWGKHK